MKTLTKVGVGLTVLWIGAFALIVTTNWPEVQELKLNAWGDFLAGFSAPLALIWLVVGYFQQGEELRLNTQALEAQQEELRRQVQETAFLAKNAERQAAAAELLADLNWNEKEQMELKEKLEAQPIFWRPGGGSVTGGKIKTNVVNRGGEVTDVKLGYEGPYRLTLSRSRLWKNEEDAELTLHQPKDVPLEFPFEFSISYVDKFGEEHVKHFEYTKGHVFDEKDT